MMEWLNDGHMACLMNGIAILGSDWIKHWWNDGILELRIEGNFLNEIMKQYNDTIR